MNRIGWVRCGACPASSQTVRSACGEHRGDVLGRRERDDRVEPAVQKADGTCDLVQPVEDGEPLQVGKPRVEHARRRSRAGPRPAPRRARRARRRTRRAAPPDRCEAAPRIRSRHAGRPAVPPPVPPDELRRRREENEPREAPSGSPPRARAPRRATSRRPRPRAGSSGRPSGAGSPAGEEDPSGIGERAEREVELLVCVRRHEPRSAGALSLQAPSAGGSRPRGCPPPRAPPRARAPARSRRRSPGRSGRGAAGVEARGAHAGAEALAHCAQECAPAPSSASRTSSRRRRDRPDDCGWKRRRVHERARCARRGGRSRRRGGDVGAVGAERLGERPHLQLDLRPRPRARARALLRAARRRRPRAPRRGASAAP